MSVVNTIIVFVSGDAAAAVVNRCSVTIIVLCLEHWITNTVVWVLTASYGRT